ncbi:DUF2871 domain-containing protein [Microbacterium sp.]|uniref:DUF2871 domain-containing protein n=1 Tax=Microbacterium sp. TaxID=51671 RepID=UPI003A9156B4
MAAFSQRLVFIAVTAYLVLGLGAGLVYRELTKHADVAQGQPLQLGVMHTHLLTLGFIVMLIVLALDRLFALGRHKLFPVFFWVYNAGLLLTVAMMAVQGSTVLAGGEESPAVAGMAGMGHIIMTIGLLVFVVVLGSAVWRHVPAAAAEHETAPEPVER